MARKILTVNGVERKIIVSTEESLANVLRRQLGLTGTKVGCGEGQCGCCNVILDEKLVRSCVTKMEKVPDGASVTTIEGIGTPDNPHPIQLAWAARGAAQCGFCTPGFVVSTKALLDQNPNPSREDVRDWFQVHRNACRCTGYKMIVDAVMDSAKVLQGKMRIGDLEFKMPADGRIWGTTYPRPSAMYKATGTWDFGADLALKMPADTLRLALVQAKVSHANILSIDTSEAEKMPGVFKVITHKDVKGRNRINRVLSMPGNRGDGWDRPILCDQKVFQYGDTIAIVAADTEVQAKAAAERVKVNFEALPAHMSAPAAMAEDAIEIHPGTPNIFFVQKLAKGGETKPVFEKAAHIVEGEFYVGRQPHMPMEPDCGVAYWDGSKLFVQSKSIALNLHRAMISDGVGIPIDDLHIIQNNAGGTFGYKASPTLEALLAVAAIATGRPVSLVYDYRQQMTYTGKRSPFWMKLRLAADKEGKLLGMETDYSIDHGPYSELGDLVTIRGVQCMGAGYDIPNIRGEGRVVSTNHSWGAPFRAFGSPQSEFASESLMDMLAEKMGVDPLELRYRNCYRKGSTTPCGQDPEVFPLPQMFDILRPKYQEALKKAKANSNAEKKCGVGISVGIYGAGTDGPDTSNAAVELNPDGGVTLYDTWEDHGQGADMGALGTAHEALRPLGLPPQKIRRYANDTSKCPDSNLAAGSRSQYITGRAIKAACDSLVDGMRKPGGGFRTYDEMVKENIPLKYTGTFTSPGIPVDENGQGSPFTNYMYGLFMAEVSVEMKSGKTTVDKMTMIADVGAVNNKLVVDGQLYGGMAQGIGLALSEEFEDIQKHSTLAGAGFPYIKTIPDNIEIIHMETPRPLGPFGASGVGELPLTSPHAAVINAIHKACGVRIKRLPALPGKVLAELKKKK
jgi:aldehyde oxidoreductase